MGVTTAGVQNVEASSNINEDYYVKKLEEFTNTDLDIELIPWRDYNQKIQLIFAGGELPDLLQTQGITSPDVAPALEADVFMPLNDLIDQHAPNLKKHIPEEAWNSPKVNRDGRIYGIPALNYILNGTVTFVRKDWLDKLGLSVPATVEEYIDLLRAFKDGDPNDNGKQDEIPFSARENFAFGEAFFGAYDVPPGAWKYIDGELVPNFIRPEIKEALAIYQTLYEEKLIDNEFMVQQGKEWDSKIKGQGVVGMWQHSPNYPDKWLAEVKQGVSSAELQIIPAPVGPDGKGGASVSRDAVGMIYMIPKSNKNPEAAIKFLDWFYTEEAQKFMTYGIEGIHYTTENGTIHYNYPEAQEEVYDESMRQYWLRFIGPEPLENKEFMENKPNGKLVLSAIEIANNEGRVNDGDSMPILPTMQVRPELGKNGLFMEFAAKVITGKSTVEEFDTFVEEWKKRGGDKVIEEATEWYHSIHSN